MYFSVSSPKYVNCPSNSFEQFVENYGNFIRYFITIYSVQDPYIYLYNDPYIHLYNVPSLCNIFIFIIFIIKNLSTNVTELCIFIWFLLLVWQCILSWRFPKNFMTSVYVILIFYVLNHYIVDIERPDEMCSLTLVVDDFSELFLHPSNFSIKNWRSA